MSRYTFVIDIGAPREQMFPAGSPLQQVGDHLREHDQRNRQKQRR